MQRQSLAAALILAACPGPRDVDATSVEPSSSSGDALTTGGATEAATSTACPVGADGCACTPAGYCDAGLVCDTGVCGEGCAVGSLGCACTEGGACDAGLECDAGICAEPEPVACGPDDVEDCCGNGAIDPGEECDDGGANGDGKGCTSACKIAVCGDGLVGPGEVCDGGWNCSDVCTLTTCGNGTIDPDEWCEPAGIDDPECTPLCTDARKIIFVSSEHYRGGEIGGLAGGDAKCQALAGAAGLAGGFKVWLATSKEDAPLVRFAWFDGPYVDVNGEQIAATWSEIYNSKNDAPLTTEHGEQADNSELTWPWVEPVTTHLLAWASALAGPGGPATDPATCGAWADVGKTGSAALLDPDPSIPNGGSGTFKASWGGAPCSAAAPIICVEQ